MTRVCINGFGRIGRCICKILFEDYDELEVVQINDPEISIQNAVYLLKHDSIYGKFDAEIFCDEKHIIIKNQKNTFKILYTSDQKVCNLNNSNVLVESSNQKFSVTKLQSLDFEKIFLTKWLKKADKISISGIHKNHKSNPKIISCGICDTAAIVPFLSKFDKNEIECIFITTLHPFLGYQNVLDGPPRDVVHTNIPHYQIGRGSLNAVIPKKSSVQGILEDIFPYFKNKLSFMTYRVPTEVVTTCDINIMFKPTVTNEKLNQIAKQLDSLWVKEESPLISRDFNFSKEDFEYDGNWTTINGNNLHVTLWYNNELGYSATVCRSRMQRQ